MKEDSEVRIIIAGGGTGGHLFPGIAMAEEFLRINSKSKIMFVGTVHGIENRVIPDEGFSFFPISAYGLFGKSLLQKVKGMVSMLWGSVQSMGIILKQKPDLIIGVGGYASAPMLLAALVTGKKFVIQEQNSIPGNVNTLFGKWADTVFTSFEDTKNLMQGTKKVVCSGNPIRTASNVVENDSILKSSDKFRILVFGGSLGAHAINEMMQEVLPLLKGSENEISILHQTGQKDFKEVEEAYKKSGMDAEVKPFVDKLYTYYQYADLIICRAGATTIAELTNYGKAALLIPFPHAIKNHQELNARELEKEGAAFVHIEKELNVQDIANTIIDLKNNPEKLRTMGENAKKLGHKNASEAIVKECYSLIEK